MVKRIGLPLDERTIKDLRAGDEVLLTGTLYSARDAAHRRMVDALERSEPLPFDIRGQVIYYLGPSPARPGQVIGSAGPTTSGRMDPFTARLLVAGLKGMIGKGKRSAAVKRAIPEYGAVYFGAVGGIGALLSKTIVKSQVIAYDDLGAEAVRRLEVRDLPVTVINDVYGGDLYESGKARYCKRV